MKKRILSLLMCLVMCSSVLAMFPGCGSAKPDAIVIMTEDLDGLFNPFFATTGADMGVVGMTQIGMLTTDYVNGEAVHAYGDGYACVAQDIDWTYSSVNNTTTYTFVLKNGLTFSDGHPITMEDVLFNMYVYLDPAYSGSSTMYSTEIIGLKEYRTQQQTSGDSNADDMLSKGARDRAQNRINELINIFMAVGKTSTEGSYSADYDTMRDYILNTHKLSSGYISAVAVKDGETVTVNNLLADYEKALALFHKELENDYVSAKESYLESPYKETGEFDEITSFMYAEGYVKLEYEEGADGKADKTKIKKVIRNYTASTKEEAITYVYNTEIEKNLHVILRYWATAQDLLTEYTVEAKEVIMKETLGDGELAIKNISGIVSLGHTTDVTKVTVNNKEYTVAQQHNADGTPANEGEYDVLQITIKGVDPKAIWNFGFTVAPQHYYAEGYTVDIANNNFGVDYCSHAYMSNVLQSARNVKLPMGAGAYKATDRENSDNPSESGFFTDNVVYFKANDKFLLGVPKTEKIRYQIVSSSNAINALQSGTVHYVTPQLTDNNINLLNGLVSQGIKSVYTDQLGYGYIGINAGLVPDINIRKAIMSAMDTSLAIQYYRDGTAQQIYYPMSIVNWAYPKDAQGKPSRDNGKTYPAMVFNREDAIKAIKDYMAAAGVSAGDPSLSIKFTIAGSNLTEHPTYATFQNAADILNECGWNIEVVPDMMALTKLSSGGLAVWAAAWGSTIDPDMYQVYHKNSTASSVKAWGYNAIINSPGSYPIENNILNKLSQLIDEARKTDNRTTRIELYEQAMSYVLDLAVELPVYQRSVLYAYNSNVIDPNSLPTEINPYSSPLDRIWEIEMVG